MKFLEILENTLKHDDRFVGEDGRILKTKVYDACMGMDKLLLKRLLNNETLKSHFFEEVKGTSVFDKMKFAWVLESREFLPDSYTMFKNKIGLADSKGQLISRQSNVTLVWPYKDCVLEGGQTKEDQKRDEIFYNETLAPDEISRLLYPKVFAKAKRYSKNGVEEISEFGDADNLIIKGNNLLALASVQKRYEGKVKCVYIDPPYNTGGDGFNYNDSFNRSSWLTFMKNRLVFAKSLLSVDGSIWISIDDNEAHYLKILLDEVFGEENLISNFIWQNNIQAKGYSDTVSLSHNHIIAYRLTDKFQMRLLERTEEHNNNYKNPDNDPNGPWRPCDVRNSLYRPNLMYNIKTPSGKIIPYPENGWRFSRETFERELAEGKIIFSKDETRIIRKIYLKDQAGRAIESLWFAEEVGSTRQANSEIKALFGEKVFDTPKPERLIQRIIHIASNQGDIILDYHLGSGTTVAVAHKMGRQYIGIEQMDYINTVTVPRLQKVIQGEQGGVSQEVNWQGGGSFVYCELMEQNESVASALQAAHNSEDVQAILNQVTNDGLIIPSVLPDDLRSHMDEFAEMPLAQQRKLVMELIDKNRLYVNLCDMDDEELSVSDADKAFTRSFYRMDEKGGM